MPITEFLNGQPRKQLSDQLDRLDGIIDIFEEGLTGAVTEAMKDGCRTALKETILELLTHPEILGPLRDAIAKAANAPPVLSLKQRILNRAKEWAKCGVEFCKQITRFVVDRSQIVVTNLRTKLRTADEQIRMVKFRIGSILQTINMLCRVKQLALISAGIGAVAGVATYLAPHELAAIAGGVGGATTAAGVQLGIGAKSFVRKLQLLTC